MVQNQTTKNQTTKIQTSENQTSENRPQLSTKVSSTNKSNTYSLIESENAIYKKGPAARRLTDDLCGYEKEHYRDKGLSDSGYETPEQAGARKKEEEKEALRRYLEKNMVSGHKEQYIDFILNYKDILDDDYVPPEPPKQQAERTAEAFGNGKGRFGGGKIYLDETPHDQAFYDSIKGLLDM